MPIEELLMKVSPLTSARSTARCAPLGDHLRRLVEIERDAEILGEMIERAERQNAEGNARAGKHPCQGANAAVAAANHDRVDLTRLGALERGLGEKL